jgi:hypothetical protein
MGTYPLDGWKSEGGALLVVILAKISEVYVQYPLFQLDI